MNTETLRQNAAAMLAFADGKPIQFRGAHEVDPAKWIAADKPSFDCNAFDYRPKPEPVVRPWTFEEAPVELKVKSKDGSGFATLWLFPAGFQAWRGFADTRNVSFSQALEIFTQLDGSPCGTTEAQP